MNAGFKLHAVAEAIDSDNVEIDDPQGFARGVVSRLERHGLEVVPTGTERALSRCMEVILRKDLTMRDKLQWIQRICEAHAPHH